MKLFIVLAFTVVSARAAASLNTILHPAFFEGRIINGQDAVKGEAPFVVSLKSGFHFCGGSIIDEHWVLTAGHCLIYNSFKVIAGLHQRSDESDVQIREVSSKKFQFVHEKYSGNVGPYDIGLIYITEPFNLNAVTRSGFAPVAKIKLPSGKYEQTGKGKLYGWGYDNSGDLSNTLQTLETNIIGYRECKRALPFPTLIHSTNICTYTIDTSDGACNGDSGGPLVRYTPDGAEIVGIVSWGFIPCDITKYPTVYTMTSAFSDWIQKIINNFTTGDMPYKLAKRYYINKLKSMT